MRCSGGSARPPLSKVRGVVLTLTLGMALAACSRQQTRAAYEEPIDDEPIERETIMQEAQDFFGRGAEGLADVLNRLFRERGDPIGYIKGSEGGGALGVGLRYGRGTLYLRDGASTDIYWRGPSVGIDVGGSAAKAFILIYDLPTLDALFDRYGGVEGSLFFVGGVGANYNRSGATLIAPVRFGVGWRQGVNIGYLHFSPDRSWVPF